MRHDIFIRRGAEWSLYVEAVTPGNSLRIAGVLERQGESVLITTHGRVLGKHVYCTAPMHHAEQQTALDLD